MSEFIRADITRLEGFVTQSEEAIQEFADIRNEFDEINKTLLNNWKGSGKNAYEDLSSDILEKVGGISDVLNTINDTILKDIIDKYNSVDRELAEYNRTAGNKET